MFRPWAHFMGISLTINGHIPFKLYQWVHLHPWAHIGKLIVKFDYINVSKNVNSMNLHEKIWFVELHEFNIIDTMLKCINLSNLFPVYGKLYEASVKCKERGEYFIRSVNMLRYIYIYWGDHGHISWAHVCDRGHIFWAHQ